MKIFYYRKYKEVVSKYTQLWNQRALEIKAIKYCYHQSSPIQGLRVASILSEKEILFKNQNICGK